MADDRRVLQAVLVKVRLGEEQLVLDWLRRKTADALEQRHCQAAEGTDRRCNLCTNDQLDDVKKRPKGLELPCEEMDVLAISYLTGPFDFMLLARTSHLRLVEDFLVRCLRSGDVADSVVDTQTLTGLLHYPLGDNR